MLNKLLSVILLGAAVLPQAPCFAATRLKDLVSLEGVRDNQLIGYGLVVGLAGTGDRRQTIFSAQSLANMLQQMGVAVAPTAMQVRNTAAVMITATLPPFAQPGAKIDVTAGAIGDAANLQGGLLLLTTLRGIDGSTYAVAQGPVVTGGFVASKGGSSSTLNHPTVGRVPNGAIVERAAPSLNPAGPIKLQLRQADFTTASRIVAGVNQRFGSPVASAENSGLVQVKLPADYATRSIDFIAELEKIPVDADQPARVIVNERTGTIVMGKDVKIAPVAIMHGALSVEIQMNFTASQPQPFSQGQTTIVPETKVGVSEEKAKNIVLQDGATVEQLVRALMSIGSTPRDIIAILQNLRSAGALDAVLEVI